MDEHDAWEVGQTTPIEVAGRTIGNPLLAVIAYLKEHPGTVTYYDFIAGTSGEVTAGLIKATRMPWMASRISAREEAWFIERGSPAARPGTWSLLTRCCAMPMQRSRADSMTGRRRSGTISGPAGQRVSPSPRSARSCIS